MPDGKPYLKKSVETVVPKIFQSSSRGKDAFWDLLVEYRSRVNSNTLEGQNELAEIRAMEKAGVRRRRRYLNDKVLRDMAGPMRMADMMAQFNPVPFGETHHMSALTLAAQPENASVWESFRSIDPDKQERVLQKWEAHVAEQQAASSSSKAKVPSPCADAASALKCWARVSKKARTALRKANIHSVVQLESQVMDLLILGDGTQSLQLPMEDAFGRLLVHGIAEYHDLLSCSKTGAGCVTVVVSFRAGSTPVPLTPEITCSDVLSALHEAGPMGLTHTALHSYIQTHVHGTGVNEQLGYTSC
ncbi:MAG: hypothetical protein WDW36_006937 [Sanguina aurantia]